MRTHPFSTTMLVIIALLLAGVGLAQPGRSGGFDGAWRGLAAGAAPTGIPLARHLGRLPGVPHLAGLPIGTTVELAFFDVDPAEGGAAVTTLSLTVGVDSEARFAADVAAARAAAADGEASYLVATIGERTHTVGLADDDAAPRSRDLGPMGLSTLGMGEGDTIAVTLYAGDPGDGGAVLERLTFTYGVDSEIGFRSALRAAAVDADTAVVVASPRTITLELGAVDARAAELRGRVAARGRAGGFAARDPAPRAGMPRPLLPGRSR
jgi:hypothetical protein